MSVAAYIARLRADLAMEAPARLHTHSTASGARHTMGGPADDEDGAPLPQELWVGDAAGYGTQIGLPFTFAFERYLGHADFWGRSRLAMSSILEVSERCSARHPSHRIPGRPRSLCGQLLFEVGYFGQSVDDIAWLHGMSRTQIERMLLEGLRHAEQWREGAKFERPEADFDANEPLPNEPLPQRKSAA